MAEAQGGGTVSLLDDFASKCVLMEKTRTPDGESGYITVWKEGAEFKNYFVMDSSLEARRAEQEGVTSLYSALVDKSVPIEYNDYFRDKTTGLTYRVTSNPEEKQAPKSAGSVIRALKFFAAERKELPS